MSESGKQHASLVVVLFLARDCDCDNDSTAMARLFDPPPHRHLSLRNPQLQINYMLDP